MLWVVQVAHEYGLLSGIVRVHLTRPGPADAVVDRQPAADLPAILREPLYQALPHIRPVAHVGFRVTVEYAQRGIRKRVVRLQRIQRILAEVERAGENALLPFIL